MRAARPTAPANDERVARSRRRAGWRRLPCSGRSPDSNARHEAVVRAILAGSDGKARAAVKQHVDATSALVRAVLA